MNGKRKIDKKNLIIFIVILAIVGIAIGFLVGKLVIGNSNKPTTTPKPTSSASASPSASASASAETTEGIVVTSNNYQAYQSDDLNFKFVIATLHVKSNENINITLDHFVTSEGIKLSDVNTYQEQLVSKEMSLSKENTVSKITSNSKECDAKVFIPVKNVNASTITVTYDIGDKKELSFNLTSAKDAKEAFGKDATPASEEMSMSIDQVFEITGDTLYSGDTEYMIPSTARVYVVHMNVTTGNKGDLSITNGKFAVNGYGDVSAEASAIHSLKYKNILGQTMENTGDGYFFFIVLDPDRSLGQLTGTVSFSAQGESGNTDLSIEIQ